MNERQTQFFKALKCALLDYQASIHVSGVGSLRVSVDGDDFLCQFGQLGFDEETNEVVVNIHETTHTLHRI